MNWFKATILRLATVPYGARHMPRISAVANGKCTEPRPLAYDPDWWVGTMAMDAPSAQAAITYRRVHRACVDEWNLRRKIKAAEAEAAARAQPPTVLMQRYQVDVRFPSATAAEVLALRWFTMPRGTVFRQHLYIDHGNVQRFVLDVPIGEQVEVTSPRVTAIVIGVGTVDGPTA